MRGFCEKAQVDCIDLLPDFEEVPDPLSLWVNRFDGHPSEEANKLAAEVLLRALPWETVLQDENPVPKATRDGRSTSN